MSTWVSGSCIGGKNGRPCTWSKWRWLTSAVWRRGPAKPAESSDLEKTGPHVQRRGTAWSASTLIVAMLAPYRALAGPEHGLDPRTPKKRILSSRAPSFGQVRDAAKVGADKVTPIRVSPMNCRACGTGSQDGRRFCANCGASLQSICPRCGSATECGDRFCGECGVALASPSPPAPAVAPAPPDGERKQLTVLFADVKGSMDLQESLDPEDWAAVVNDLVEVLAEGVQRFGGTVDKFTGDGVMALFGAPVAQEDHARRACLAALHLVGSISHYADELRRQQRLELHVRLGLSSGEVVVGRVGEKVRLDSTALGHTVGLAQRMESIAEPGRIYLTQHTARLVEGSFLLEELGPMQVKGSKDPLGVFVLNGPAIRRSSRHGTDRPTAGASLVGRAAELAVLEDALAQAADGRAQVVGVVGEAGIGKSRLCDEFVSAVGERGIPVVRTAGVSHGRNVPLLPILALLRDYFDINEAGSKAAARDKIAQRLLALDAADVEQLPLMFDFLEVGDPDRPSPTLSPEARSQRVADVLRLATARRSKQEILVVLIEDLHWFDSQSEAFVERLVEWIPGSRTLVLTNFRPEFSAPWARHSLYRQLTLSPLPDLSVGELVGGMLGLDLSLAPLIQFVSERTGGNPFFVEEVVRALLEDGTIAGVPAAYRLTRPVDRINVPPSVHAVLAARIDRLAPGHKALLQTAAVAGPTFAETVLARVVEQAGPELTDGLRTLCTAGLLQVARTDPITEYRFWHPLTQEVAYATLLTRRRRRLHAAVAEALTEQNADRLEETAALLAWHWERAGRPAEAARMNVRAADYGLRTDLAESKRRWRSAIELLRGVEDTPESLQLGVRARIRLIQFGARTGINPGEAERLYSEGYELAERLGHLGLRGMLIVASGSFRHVSGDVRGGLQRWLEAAQLAEEADDADLRSALLLGAPVALAVVGPLSDALAANELVISVCEGRDRCGATVLGYSTLSRALQTQAEILLRMGRLGEARQTLGRAVAVARGESNHDSLCWGLALGAHLARLTGEDEDCISSATEAVRLGEDTGNTMSQVQGLESIALASLMAGRPSDAREACERALDVGRLHRSGLFAEAPVLALLARSRSAMGEAASATALAEEALEVAQRQGARALEGDVRLARAAVWWAARHPEREVAAELDSALAVIREAGALAYEPFVFEELGRLRGDEASLRQALRLYRTTGATGHARRLEAEVGAYAGRARSSADPRSRAL